MKHLLIGAAAVALLTACGGKDEAKTADAPAPVTTADIAASIQDITPRAGNPSEAAAALTALSLADSGSGRVSFSGSDLDGANATFSDVAIVVEDEEAPLKIGTLTFDGLETNDDGTANFGRMLMSNLSVEDDESPSGMTIASVELINPSPELAAWVASVMGGNEDEDFPSAENVSFAAWTMNNLTVNIDEEDESEGTFLIDNISINGLQDEKAGQAVLSGMKLDMYDAEDDVTINVNLDSVSIAGADLKVLAALQEAGDDEDAMAAAVADVLYDNPVDPGFDAMTLSNFTVDAGGAAFDLPSLAYQVTRNDDGEPTRLAVNPFKMTLSADADAGEIGSQLAGGLGMIGYETLELSGAGISDYDPENDIISYKAADNYFTLADGFTMNFGGKMEGYKAYSTALASTMESDAFASGNPDPDMITDAMSALTVHNFEFSFDDNSFVDRMFNVAAAQSGEDPAQMRNQLVAMMAMAPMMAGGSGVDMELVTEATSALSSFISEPGTLTLKIAPEEPLSIGALIESGDPSGLTKDALGFSASNE